jgi:hypothetical protein
LRKTSLPMRFVLYPIKMGFVLIHQDRVVVAVLRGRCTLYRPDKKRGGGGREKSHGPLGVLGGP